MTGFNGFGPRTPAQPARQPQHQPPDTTDTPRYWHGEGKHGLFYARLELPEDGPYRPGRHRRG